MNRLQYEASPYLLQHAGNPVDWYPWCGEAFEKARAQDKPVFLSVGYSTCHWCHVMAHESFEDARVAQILNENYVCVKVDKEERPDVDSIYMSACVALTGSGGWPLTAVLDHGGRPFFAGTYFPKTRRGGSPGLLEILETINKKWKNDRQGLLDSAELLTARLNAAGEAGEAGEPCADRLCERAAQYFKAVFDPQNGGFGRAPKFPSAHNLLFLLAKNGQNDDEKCLKMVQKTLVQISKGGIFDHVGYGFSRYSTDERWLVPHFEKMLYDNALLLAAYAKAYSVTADAHYRAVAEKTITYLGREMTDAGGAFYSAQDADSDGIEGKYYVWTPGEVAAVLGEADGRAFCELYDITESGNFEGKSIPNRLARPGPPDFAEPLLEKLYEYRKTRAALHRDDKILTSWNALAIAALADCADAFGEGKYLDMAARAMDFIERHLCEGDRLFASLSAGRRGKAGFLDDYAFTVYAFLRMYRASPQKRWLDRALALARAAVAEFFDGEAGGFFLYGSSGERLIARPKECYDGATPSGNSVMAMNLILLELLTGDRQLGAALERQLAFMNAQAAQAPAGHSFYLYSLLLRDSPGTKITAALADASEREAVARRLQGRGWVVILDGEQNDYPLKDGKTTYYVCQNRACLPPVNEL